MPSSSCHQAKYQYAVGHGGKPLGVWRHCQRPLFRPVFTAGSGCLTNARCSSIRFDGQPSPDSTRTKPTERLYPRKRQISDLLSSWILESRPLIGPMAGALDSCYA